MPRKSVVAGGAGFIGRHLCAALLERGDIVTCVDNFSTSSRTDLGTLMESPRFRVVQGAAEDVTWRKADIVFHLASPASPRHYQRLSIETMLANSLGTLRLAALAMRTGARFVFASTSEVYGDPLLHPQREDYWGNVNPIGVRACYDEAKRFGEALLMEHHRRHGLDVRIARIFNTYGPGMALDDGRLVPEAAVALLRGEPVLLHNGGDQTRSMCYVSDTVAGLLRLGEVSDISGEVFNLGNPVEHTVREIALAVAAAAGVVPTLHSVPGVPDDPARRKPDITRARTILGWEPKVTLPEGLRATIDDFRARI